MEEVPVAEQAARDDRRLQPPNEVELGVEQTARLASLRGGQVPGEGGQGAADLPTSAPVGALGAEQLRDRARGRFEIPDLGHDLAEGRGVDVGGLRDEAGV